jgi:hypothetical protein
MVTVNSTGLSRGRVIQRKVPHPEEVSRRAASYTSFGSDWTSLSA